MRMVSEPKLCLLHHMRLPLAALLAVGIPFSAHAYDFSFSGLDLKGKFQAQLSLGAAIRVEDRSNALIGKTNISGQEQFCEDKPIGGAPGINCTTVAGNAAYLALPGLASNNSDNGDLNYEKGDIVAAAIRFAPRFSLSHPLFGVDISGIGFYDPINYDFEEYHPNNSQDNNGFQPRNTKRRGVAQRELGLDAQLLDAYITTSIPLPAERELAIKIGNQILSLGTTTLLVLNGLNTVNPPRCQFTVIAGFRCARCVSAGAVGGIFYWANRFSERSSFLSIYVEAGHCSD